MGENYCPHVSLEEYKNIAKEKNIKAYINEGLEISSDDSDKEDSNKGVSDNKDSA